MKPYTTLDDGTDPTRPLLFCFGSDECMRSPERPNGATRGGPLQTHAARPDHSNAALFAERHGEALEAIAARHGTLDSAFQANSELRAAHFVLAPWADELNARTAEKLGAHWRTLQKNGLTTEVVRRARRPVAWWVDLWNADADFIAEYAGSREKLALLEWAAADVMLRVRMPREVATGLATLRL